MSVELLERETVVRSPSGPALRAWGSGPPDGPPVILLHGLTMSGQQMRSSSVGLERRGFRVVSYDARGHGGSDAAAEPSGYTYDLLAQDLVAVLDAFEIERPVLVGNSMGSHTALRLALDDPGRVAALAVVSPAFDPRAHPHPANVAEADALASGLRARGVDGFIDALRMPAGHARDSATVRAGHALTRRRLADHRDLHALADALQANLRAHAFDRFDELAKIAVPVLVVGTRDELDHRHPLELARAYASALPTSHFECERPGELPLGWGGRRLTRAVAALAERA